MNLSQKNVIKNYITSLSSEIRQNNIHLYQLGIDMSIISKMKEKLKKIKNIINC
jgi:hypothetical protein